LLALWSIGGDEESEREREREKMKKEEEKGEREREREREREFCAQERRYITGRRNNQPPTRVAFASTDLAHGRGRV